MKIKICGMTRQADLDAAAGLGCDFCGFIFHAKSPRRIDPEKARDLESGSMRRVGVFVNQSAKKIMEIMAIARLDLAQLHGRQTVEDALEIGAERVMRVLWPACYQDMASMNKEAEKWRNACACFLLDAGLSGGGSGLSIPEKKLANLRLPKDWFLAGGLGEDNIRHILELCSPAGLDFNSGLEDKPGCKNHHKMERVIHICRKENR